MVMVVMSLKMTMVCGKNVHMDRWVRRITSSTTTTTTTSNNNSKIKIKSREGEIRVSTTINTIAMAMEKSKGSTTPTKNGMNGERLSVGWRLLSCAQFGAEKGLGLARNWGQKKGLFSESNKGVVVTADMGGGSADERNERRQDDEQNNKDQCFHSNHQQEHKPLGLLTLPTILTLGRVAAVPLLVTTFYLNTWWAPTATTSIFIAAAVTDWLDGYIARKMRLNTAFGAFLDPVADKLMVAATLVLLCTRPLEVAVLGGEVPWLLPIPAIAIIGREITMSAVREWAASQNSKVLEAVAVNNLGKWKTASQMAALTILLVASDSSLIGSEILVPLGLGLLYTSAGLALWSLVVYMKKIWRLMF